MENIFTLYIYWDPPREMFSFNLPLLNRPILWYGFFFALGFFLGYLFLYRQLKEFLRSYGPSKVQLSKLGEQLSLYVILGTVIGARLGDVLFYQSWADSVQDPWGILRFWEGGLASHGGVAGVMVALWFFCKKMRNHYPIMTWLSMADLLVVPASLVACCIRIGNFFNQEILGTVTTVPWGIFFGHPYDGSMPALRHPVQLYEALFYLFLFFLLWSVKKGKKAAIFFVLAFSFRFFIEFFKTHQSALLDTHTLLDMGQILSIPFIIFGVLLFFRKEQERGPLHIKGN